ncbi:galactose oxidase [Pontibacter qinzhouensis]|uniref:Galactose oxidase n=1 Tax=Pontibacter qinzhouensis TaxID=2603253 RepID=A0A5C8KA53_9BACT|nr:kelch repeat-containing protein [Pontibacter qinzhouensis]TXK45707.1 galactose oxidase [Pontibacter qinzhouensis]
MDTLTRHLRQLLRSACILIALLSFSSCDSSEEEEEIWGNWIRQSEFSGVARSGAVSFTIGDKAYVGTGYDGRNRLQDFWQYDPTKSAWIRKAEFPGAARSAAVSFAANGKGYVGTGFDGVNYLRDFWEYDPATDTWTQIADFPGTARYGALALTIQDKGYIGAGYDGNYLKDFWQYDPASGQWTEKVGLGGAKRLNGFAFAQNGKGYVGGGRNNSLYETDLLEYDPVADSWKRLKSLTSDERDGETYPLSRASAITLEINNRAYLVTGTNGSLLSEVWEYDALSDLWTRKNDFDGGAREGAVGFVIDNRGYISTGNYSTYRFDDLWLFDPAASAD